MSLLFALIVVLVIAIFFLLFRIQSLASLVKTPSEDKVGFSNKVNGFLMLWVPILGLAATIWYSPIAAKKFLPKAASIHGVETDQLFWITIAVISAMFLVTNAALFWFAYKYQYNKNRKVSFFHDNTKLETFWTILPAVIMAVLVLYGNKVWWDIKQDAPKDAVQVEIMGHQFAWKVRYPGKDQKLGKFDFRLIDGKNEMGIDFEDKTSNDDFMAGEMHLPVNKPVLMKIRARDVLHSVFAPHFRLKMDAVPGMPTSFYFVPTKTTAQMREETGNPNFNYEIACTEVCGKGHFAMKFIVVVEDEPTYNKWYAAQSPFLEKNPEYKGKGLSQFLKKNLAENASQEKQQASIVK